MKSPNVILVMTDDQGYGDLACTGNPWIKTPNIDKFYNDSVRLTDYHVQPLCTPTRGALMTGHRPIRNGAWATCWGRSILRETETTMPDIFSENGYRTGMFGKWHLGDNYPYRPFDRGFDVAIAHKGGGVGQTPDFWGNNYFDDTYYQNGKENKYIGYCTDIWFDEAMKFIDETDDDQPFFAYISTNAPHSPFLVEDKYAEQYRNNPDIPDAEFYGMITNIDENFGKLMQFLDDRKLADNTILIFMTDNGSCGGGVHIDKNQFVTKGFNAGMRGRKGSYYDGGHRVPFFIRHPKSNITGGRDVNDMALDVDLLPSLIDLCGLKSSENDFDGESFATCFKGQSMPERTQFIQIKQDPGAPDQWTSCVMTQDWRLIGYDELYNIKEDPGQKVNVINKFPDIAEKLRNENSEWWKEAEKYFHDHCAISLGAEQENPTTLVAMDIMGDVVWQQPHVAKAQKATGYWHINIERSGKYRFSLRRWPSERDLGISEVITEEEAENLAYGKDSSLVNSINPNTASLTLFDEIHTQSIDASQSACHFELEVKKSGKGELEAWFLNDEEKITSAYYIDVELLEVY